MVKVSVIIPAYNSEQYLRQCLDSVVKQTLEEIEIICIDDGSTDATYHIFREYEEKYNNIQIYTQENQGVSYARNRGIMLATGEYIAFMDADDYYYDGDTLKCLYETAKKENASICGGSLIYDWQGVMRKPQDEAMYFERASRRFFRDEAIVYGFTRFIYLKELLHKEKIAFPSVGYFEDPYFLILAMIKAEEYYVIDKAVYVYRVGTHDREVSYAEAVKVLNVMRDMFWEARNHGICKLQLVLGNQIIRSNIQYIIPYYDLNNREIVDLWDEVGRSIIPEIREQMTDQGRLFTSQGVQRYIQQCEKEYFKLRDVVTNSQNIIIYGAGRVGRAIVKSMEKDWGKKPFAITVTKLGENQECINDVEVTDISSWSAYKKEAVFVVAVLRKNETEETRQILENMGVEEIYVPDCVKLMGYLRRKKVLKGSIIEDLVVKPS